jgi:WXG100 family type VII secretion target
MPGPIGVSPENLQALSEEIRQGAAAIELILGELERKIAPFVDDWQGEARESFEGLWGQWQGGAGHVHQALVAISELLEKAGLAYAEAERSIAAAFQV